MRTSETVPEGTQLKATAADGATFYHVDINRTASTSVRRALAIQDRPRHLTALMQRDLFGEGWENAFTFSVVRNPFHRAVSIYLHRVCWESCPFDEWVDRAFVKGTCSPHPRQWYYPMLFRPQIEWLSDVRGTVLVDFIGFFEHLDVTWEYIRTRAGKGPPKLQRHPAADYAMPWYAYYEDERTETVIREHYRKDFDAFGYPDSLDACIARASPAYPYASPPSPPSDMASWWRVALGSPTEDGFDFGPAAP